MTAGRVFAFAAFFPFFCAAASYDRLPYTHGSSTWPAVALTFDDGPHPVYTRKVLNLLRNYNAHATFFVVGEMVDRHPELLAEVEKEGHEIGNHTQHHLNFFHGKDGPGVLEREVRLCDARIARQTGRRARFLRMPYGYYRPWVGRFARKKGYVLVAWSFGCDWQRLSAQKMTRLYKENIRPGAILLFHDGGKDRTRTEAVLEEVLPEIRARGYRAVRVSDLLGIPAARLE